MEFFLVLGKPKLLTTKQRKLSIFNQIEYKLVTFDDLWVRKLTIDAALISWEQS